MSEQIETTPEPAVQAQPLTPAERLAQGQREIAAICERLKLALIAAPQFRPDGNGGWTVISPIDVKMQDRG